MKISSPSRKFVYFRQLGGHAIFGLAGLTLLFNLFCHTGLVWKITLIPICIFIMVKMNKKR